MSNSYVDIFVLPRGYRFQALQGANLLEELVLQDVALTPACGGAGICRKCTVWIAVWNPDEIDADKIATLSIEDCKKQLSLRQSLACFEKVDRPLIVWTSDLGKTQILTHHTETEESYANDEPTVRFSSVVMEQDIRADVKNLENLGVSRLSLMQIAKLPTSLRNAKWRGNLTAFQDRFIAFESIDAPPVKFALALDIGTTTLALALMDVSKKQTLAVTSRHNPQSGVGDDVVARIQKSSESAESQERLRMVVVNAVNEMIGELIEQTGILADQIAAISIAGNSVMQQLFCGLDSTWLGFSPFVPVTLEYPIMLAAGLGINIHEHAVAMIFPVIGGFVGGDIVSGIIATQMMQKPGPSLLVDIGTNGEMVLWHNNRLDCVATAAGPAFEGARIEQGMIASTGAIERVTIDETVNVQTIGNGPPLGICGSGLIDAAAEMLRLGIILPNGQLATSEKMNPDLSEDLKTRFTTFQNQRAYLLSRERNILLTQRDVRQLQLAAGAIRSGITLLLRSAGLEQSDLQTVYLAGGFGNYIRRENAQRLGILPSEIPTERILFSGNTSLAGAKMVLMSRERFEQMRTISELSEHVDLSAFPDFQTVFADSMIFPVIGER